MVDDWLTLEEGHYTTQVLQELSSCQWTTLLLRRINEQGGVIAKNKPLLFEARFAYELVQRHVNATYEFNAGVGESTVDFRISGAKEWLIELFSIRESEGVKAATRRDGDLSHFSLSTTNLLSDSRKVQKQSEEAEMITAQQKIGEKVLSGGDVIKFPPPTNAIQAILIDMRGYLASGGDVIDYRQIAYGPAGILPDCSELVHFWDGKPIRGLFEQVENHPLRASSVMQERIHFLGFVVEEDYRPNEMAEKTYWVPNPHLLSNQEAADVFKTHPLLLPHA